MQEKLLHFIWRFQLFHNFNLKTTEGESLRILDKGIWNKIDSGPDFSLGKIEYNGQIWAGSIEMHIRSSDWDLHKHSSDSAYENVILHVVHEHDREVEFIEKRNIPTLELKKYIFPEVLNNHNELFDIPHNFIPCENSIHLVKKEKITFWLERLVIERLERKTEEIEQEFKANNKDWERLLFKKMAYSFGLKVNADAFLLWADSFDYKVLQKIQTNPNYVHALFYGQAGFLNFSSKDEYVQELQKDYEFLKGKYNLSPIEKSIFKFSRMRPWNFPTVRMMQLAVLYSTYQNLFSFLTGTKDLTKILPVFMDLDYPKFWKNHFTFEKESNSKSEKKISVALIYRVIINVIIPIKYIYSKSLGENSGEELIDWLREIPPENNSIIEEYKKLGLKAKSAFDTQAYLELNKHFCKEKKCLNCAIGLQIMKNV